MKKILTERNHNNTQFKVVILKENKDDSFVDIIKSLHNEKLVLTSTIINEINKGYEYYTKDNNGEYSLVTIKDGEERGPYLSSIANDGVTDNINELPIYK